MKKTLLALTLAFAPNLSAQPVFYENRDYAGEIKVLREGRRNAIVDTENGLKIISKRFLYDENKVSLLETANSNSATKKYASKLELEANKLAEEIEKKYDAKDPFTEYDNSIRFSNNVKNKDEWRDLITPLNSQGCKFTIVTPKEHSLLFKKGIRGHYSPYTREVIISDLSQEVVNHELGHYLQDKMIDYDERTDSLRVMIGQIFERMNKHLVSLSDRNIEQEESDVVKVMYAYSLIVMQDEFDELHHLAYSKVPFVKEMAKLLEANLSSPIEMHIMNEHIAKRYAQFSSKDFFSKYDPTGKKEFDVFKRFGLLE